MARIACTEGKKYFASIGEILERARSADPVPPRLTRFFFLHEKWRDSGMHERADLVEF